MVKPPSNTDEYAWQHEALIREILASHGGISTRTIEALRSVPRHEFVPEAYRQYAYENRPLPIGERQTISQPLMVALMTDMLEVESHHVVLEIGTGSGYQAAVLSKLASRVYTLERHESLSTIALENLRRVGCANVEVIVADGTLGWPERAPYDRILVTAGSPNVPEALVKQLAMCGRLVAPVGDFSYQTLTQVDMTPVGPHVREGIGCVFVPLIGKFGWASGEPNGGN